MSTREEIIPGMREQGKGLKYYVESEYAPLKACIVGNPSSLAIPDPDTYEMENIFRAEPPEFSDWHRKRQGKDLRETEPELAEILIQESDGLAKAYRDAGVHVIRNETGNTPDSITDSQMTWSNQRAVTLFGGAIGETFGHCYITMYEITQSNPEWSHREAIAEIIENDPEAVWLSYPFLVPHQSKQPLLYSPGDQKIFPKKVLCGIGVPDPSYIKDRSKPRSSGDEFGVEILRRMLKPYGWEVESVYYDSRYTYHFDALFAPLEEGLYSMCKDPLWTPLPKWLDDWEHLETTLEDHKMGCNNLVVIDKKKVTVVEGTKKFAKDLEKRGFDVVEVPYLNIYKTYGSGIHCSTHSVWREFD